MQIKLNRRLLLTYWLVVFQHITRWPTLTQRFTYNTNKILYLIVFLPFGLGLPLTRHSMIKSRSHPTLIVLSGR